MGIFNVKIQPHEERNPKEEHYQDTAFSPLQGENSLSLYASQDADNYGEGEEDENKPGAGFKEGHGIIDDEEGIE